MHWMDIMLSHFCVALTPHGSVALIGIEGKLPWDGEIRQVIKRCSTNPCYQLVDVLAQWQARKMFEKRGENRHCSGLVERAVASMINQRLKKRGLHWKRANINASWLYGFNIHRSVPIGKPSLSPRFLVEPRASSNAEARESGQTAISQCFYQALPADRRCHFKQNKKARYSIAADLAKRIISPLSRRHWLNSSVFVLQKKNYISRKQSNQLQNTCNDVHTLYNINY